MLLEDEHEPETKNEIVDWCLKNLSIVPEVLGGGISAGLAGVGISHIVTDKHFEPILAYILEHAGSAAVGAFGFALLGTAFAYTIRFRELKSQRLDLELREFLDENKGEILKGFAKFWLAGGIAFATYMFSSDYFSQGGTVWGGGLLAGSLSVAIFGALNYFLGLGMPVEKLFVIASVFVGFTAGAAILASEEKQSTLKTSFIPPSLAAGVAGTASLALVGSTKILKSCGFFKSKDADAERQILLGGSRGNNPLYNASGKDVQNSLLAEESKGALGLRGTQDSSSGSATGSPRSRSPSPI